jgi:hypothetical protein
MAGPASDAVSAWLARHSARMVNGRFPDRAHHGFEMVDVPRIALSGRSKRASFQIPRENSAIFSANLA